MLAKIKTSNFIDALHVELIVPDGQMVRGVLRDDAGTVCRTIEKNVLKDRNDLNMFGLNDLPYGKYTLELLQGENAISLSLVKRV